MSATYRAAYWISDDRQSEQRLTSPEQSHLTDKDLISAAHREAATAGLDWSEGEIVIGDWTDPDLDHCEVGDCRLPVYAGGKCEPHYRRAKRGSSSTAPVRARGTERLTPISLRVPASVATKLGPKPGAKARSILEAWAREGARRSSPRRPRGTSAP